MTPQPPAGVRESDKPEPEFVTDFFNRVYVYINGEWTGPFRNFALARLAFNRALAGSRA